LLLTAKAAYILEIAGDEEMKGMCTPDGNAGTVAERILSILLVNHASFRFEHIEHGIVH